MYQASGLRYTLNPSLYQAYTGEGIYRMTEGENAERITTVKEGADRQAGGGGHCERMPQVNIAFNEYLT